MDDAIRDEGLTKIAWQVVVGEPLQATRENISVNNTQHGWEVPVRPPCRLKGLVVPRLQWQDCTESHIKNGRKNDAPFGTPPRYTPRNLECIWVDCSSTVSGDKSGKFE